MKVTVVLVCVVLAFTIVAPATREAFGVTPANMNVIQYRYFADQSSLFTALLTPDSLGGVDIMGYPLSAAQYQSAVNNTGIVVEPVRSTGEFEIAFNNNWTDGIHMDRRSPTNYTDFRNAMNCLIDEDAVIAGPVLGGFASRDYTQIPQPLMAEYVNPAVSGANYPWEFNVTHALQILYNGNWYSHSVYPTFSVLLATYANGTLNSTAGTDHGVVYSGNDPNGQWGGGDPHATANAALANTPLVQLDGRYRTADGRKTLALLFMKELDAIGCPHEETGYPTLAALRPYVIDAQTYDWATLGYSMTTPPNWFYSELTPVGISPDGGNPYLVQDSNVTRYATAMFNDSTQTQYQLDSNAVQDCLVMESYLVSVYTPVSYCAYKTGMLGQIDELGYGTQGATNSGWGMQAMNWFTLDSRKTGPLGSTVNYTGPPSGTPDSNIIYYGCSYPPEALNPIFGYSSSDYEVLDEIFTYPLASNPYSTMSFGSAITGVPSGGDLPWMGYSWKTQLVDDPSNSSNPQWTNVTLWFRHDITWQDGVPFTVADLNCTIYENAIYLDSYNHNNMIQCVNTSNGYAPYFAQWDNWTCSILVTNPSWLSLYTPMCEIIPEHLYKYIIPSNLTLSEEGSATDGLHGLWPGQAASNNASNILPGAPFTLSQLQNNPETTLVGTGPWKYRVGSTSAGSFVAGGGITLDVFDGFFLKPAPGELDFRYEWLNTDPSAQPSGGYYTISLTDLVMLANAYGTVGTPPSTVPVLGIPGMFRVWNPACNVAPSSGVIGLSDLVTVSLHYHWCWGNYSFNAPYPPSEIANGGP